MSHGRLDADLLNQQQLTAHAKGKVERAIRYVRDRFFAARRFDDSDDLNRQALDWCVNIAGERPCAEGGTKTVREAFAEEQARLRKLPDNPFPCEQPYQAKVGKTPYARFDLNDYSVPHDRINQVLSILATAHRVRILDGTDIIAEHPRSYSRGEQIEDPEHIRLLRETKKHARKHAGFDRLARVAPSTENLFEIQAERGINLGSLTAQLLRLLDTYGSEDFEIAVKEAIDQGVYHADGIEQILDRRRAQRGRKTPSPIALTDEKYKELHVRPHDLGDYDLSWQVKEAPDGDA